MKKVALSLLVFALAVGLTGPVSAASSDGERLFKKCKACHSLEEGKNKIGPSLYGVFGRAAGTVEGYKYSKALRNSGIVWTEETLDIWFQGPSKLVKGTKMRMRMRKERDRQALIQYFKDQVPE